VTASRLLASCAGLSGEHDLAALRLRFAREMADVVGATRLILLGLDSERDHFAPLASWPEGLDCPVFAVFDSQREQHPISLALAARDILIEEPNELLMARLRQTLFNGMAPSRLVVVPASADENGFPDMLFLAAIPAECDVALELRQPLILYARFCARHGRLAARFRQASDASAALSRSLSHADRDRSLMRRAVPDAISGRLAGRSRPMQVLREQVGKFGPSGLSVLVTGETGTGKELVARELHRLSPRKDGPFVAVNVAALPDGLAESELFGHVRGAFTGAARDRAGHIAEADGGTLFLDEIGDMPLGLQAKLLRVLQEKRFHPVGADKEQASDFRVIAATHRNIPQMMRENLFREDLFYRLSEVRVSLPPLRDRGTDILVLAEHFLQSIADREDQRVRRLAPEAASAMEQQPFPGNVRELQALIARASIAAGESCVIEREHLWPEESAIQIELTGEFDQHEIGPRPKGLTEACDAYERQLLIESLHAASGNRQRMARDLDLSPRTLFNKMKKHRISGL
jgi:transcriptional regulator with GAF, ATPase, and Fis domain